MGAMALEQLDDVWLRCARRLDVPVARGGDAYVHFDGETLHIASQEHLDADDSLAQLILHELCHMIVGGPERRWTPDWGLDNRVASADDDVDESAAVRLQAHLTGAYGLRTWLFPTTVVRIYFDALPEDAIGGPPHDDAIPLARRAADRLRDVRLRTALAEALEATASRLALPRHRSGHPRVTPSDTRTCGSCVWRTPGGLCRQASSRIRVAVSLPACTRHEAALDCLSCGACCRGAYDAVLLGPREPIVRLRPDLVAPAQAERPRELARREDRCAALAGPPGGPWRCEAYELRPRTCREFAARGPHCLLARRRVGLSL